jgi:serine/threonine-protein kinase
MALLDEPRWKRLSPLLDQLLDLDAAARSLRLAELRALDPALADELAALLDDSLRAQACRFLDGNALDDPPPHGGGGRAC